jgi:ankyrin repeat protein
MTPLHLAAQEGKTAVTKDLMEAGASVSAVNNNVIKPQQYSINNSVDINYIKNHFSSQIFLKLTFSNSVQSHD